MEDFTRDAFKCSICSEEKYSIDEYVGHMLEEEECTMVLETSQYLKDLVLPRFKRKSLTQYNKNVTNTMPSIALEVEVSEGVRRWKCKACSLTFSREAAVLNHYKLAHDDCTVEEENKTINNKGTDGKTIKTEVTETIVDNDSLFHPLDDEMSLPSNTPDISSLKMDADEDLMLQDFKSQNDEPVCHICGQVFKSMSIVNSHIKMVHSAKRPFICNFEGCQVSFKTKGSLVRHYRRHTGDRPYKCAVCGRAYRESGSLLRHQQSKVPCYQKPDRHLPRYGITLPFNTFKNDDEMDCKLNLKKESEEEYVVNTASDDILDTDDSKAKIRKEINRSEGFAFFNETSTDYMTSERKPFLREAKKEVLFPDEVENCTEEKDFKTLDYIKSLEEAEKILRRSFVCPLCYKSYTRASFLSGHLKSHLAELGNECPTCKKKFATDHALARHLSSHSSVRQFECRQCAKAFKLKSHALNHLKSHSDIKTVPCPECGAYFKTISSRNSHLKIHIGQRNFECVICFKTFIVKASFLRHLKVHQRHTFTKVGTDCAVKTEDLTDTKRNILKCDKVDLKDGVSPDFDAVGELSDGNDFSENDSSELGTFLNEKMDLSAMYTEQSDLTLSPRDYLIPDFC